MPPPAPTRRTITEAQLTAGRSRRRVVVRLVGTAVVLALLFAVIPLDDVLDALGRVPGPVWVAALGTYLMLHLAGVLKWTLLVNAAGAGLAFGDAVRCYYYGLFANIFLPSIVGGDVVRAGLAMRLSRSRSGLLLGSVVDRFLDTVGLAAVAGMGALLLPVALDARSRSIFLIVAGVLVTAGVAGVAALSLLPGARRLPYRRKRLVAKIRQAFRAVRARPGTVIASFTLGMLLQAALVLLNAWLGDVIGVHVSPVVWLFAWPLAKIAAVLPLTQGGIGVREGALVALLQPFGVPAAAAMATGLVFTAVVMAGGLVGGAMAWLLGRADDSTPPRSAVT